MSSVTKRARALATLASALRSLGARDRWSTGSGTWIDVMATRQGLRHDHAADPAAGAVDDDRLAARCYQALFFEYLEHASGHLA